MAPANKDTDQDPKAKVPPVPPLPLPGDPSVTEQIDRMIRVDQAGEFGATQIYAGQMAVLGDKHKLSPMIRHMAEQEDRHLEAFDEMIAKRGVRPTALNPLWGPAGFALGAVTALMGTRAAMACTAAVEEVIDEHYQGQEAKLEHWNIEPELKDTIEQFRAEEVEHRDTAIEHGAEQAPGYELLSGVIRAGCRTAIWLSKRI